LAAALFLECNGEILQPTEEDVVLKSFALAEWAVSEAHYTLWLRESYRKKKKG